MTQVNTDNQKTHCIPVIHTQACNNREEPCSMMTQANTVTNDDELREKIAIMQFEKNVMDCLLIARGKGRTNMVELLPIFRDLLAFITAERAKAVLDARINELMCHRDYNGLDSEPYLLRRITELQTKRKALDNE